MSSHGSEESAIVYRKSTYRSELDQNYSPKITQFRKNHFKQVTSTRVSCTLSTVYLSCHHFLRKFPSIISVLNLFQQQAGLQAERLLVFGWLGLLIRAALKNLLARACFGSSSKNNANRINLESDV